MKVVILKFLWESRGKALPCAHEIKQEGTDKIMGSNKNCSSERNNRNEEGRTEMAGDANGNSSTEIPAEKVTKPWMAGYSH
jgi:hypothetical protein